MKILLINKFLYPKGGDAISTLATGALLRANGHEVTFWGMKSEQETECPQQDLFVDEVDLTRAKGINQQIKIAANMLYSLEAKSKLQKLIDQIGKLDIVHINNFAHQISPSILHVFKKYKIPCVMTMHDYKLVCASYAMLDHGKICEACKDGAYYRCFLKECVKDSKAKSLLNTIEMYLHHKILHIYDLIDVFISPSQFLKAKVEEMGFKGKFVYLPNFVNLDEYAPQYEPSERSIVYFGRLSPEKGVVTLIEAMKGLDVTLKIIGDGPLREQLESSVKGHHPQNPKYQIQFMGYKTGEDLKNEVRKSMFVVLPSECYENNPRTVIESFALGKPVIGARIGGIPELVKDWETGLTFDPGSADDLREKILRFLNNTIEIETMGRKARMFAEEEFNAEKHYEGLMAIYQTAINSKR